MKRSSRNVLLILLLGLIILAFVGYRYLYHGHRDIESEVAVVTMDATELKDLFSSQPSNDYLNQTLLVRGIVSEKNDTEIVLNGVVHCAFENSAPDVTIDARVEIKGRCLGYDELFEIVKMDQCSLKN